MAGQVPVSFTASEPFQNGQNRPVDVAGARYYVMDFWLPNGWESGLWVRGILEAPENPQLLTNLMFIAMVTLPAFLLLAALGGYGIARRAFRPLKEITSTAAAINEPPTSPPGWRLPPGDHEFSRLAATFNQMFARLEGAFEPRSSSPPTPPTSCAPRCPSSRAPVSTPRSTGRPPRSSGRPWP